MGGGGRLRSRRRPHRPPTSNGSRSRTHSLTWHDRIIGSLGLVVAVAVAAAALAFALYLAGSTLIGLLEKAATLRPRAPGSPA